MGKVLLVVLIVVGWMSAFLSGQESSGSWQTLAPMPLARQEISAAALNRKIYVIGGLMTSGSATSDVQVYDPVANRWSLAASLPINTDHSGAAVAGGKLYAFGGTSNRTFVYDPQNDSWTDVAAMNFMHGNTPAVAVINNRIYVAGGTGAGMTGREAEVYDPFTNTWTLQPPMNVPRNHTAGGNINAKFYVAGGRGSPAAADALEVYDPQTNLWTRLASMPTGRSGIAAGVVNGELFVFGGEIPRLFSEVEAYNPLLNRWRSLPGMPSPRHGIFGAVVGQSIYLPGGATLQALGATTITDVFTPGTTVWKVVPIVLDVNTGSAHFTTELTLTNRGAVTITLTMRYAASLGPREASGTVTTSLQAGQQHVIPDVLAYLRSEGLAIPNSAAAPQQGGILTIEFGGVPSESTVSASARTTTTVTAPHPQGSAGLAYNALPVSAASTGILTLFGLRASSQDRSNVAVFNPTAAPVSVRLTAHSGTGNGNSVVLPEITLPALGWSQLSGVLNGTGISNGWVSVERISGSGAFHAYGVVNDNSTNDGSFLLPGSGTFQGSRLTVPVLTETPLFRSELVLANRGTSTASLQLRYAESLSPGLGAGGTLPLQLAPQQQRIIPDAVDFLRRQGLPIGPPGQGSYAGALRIEVSGTSLAQVLAAARTAAQSDAGGQFGIFTPAVNSGEEASAEAWIFGLRSDAANRTNVAVVNTGGDTEGTIRLEVQIYDGASGGAATGDAFSLTLQPGQWAQLSNPMASRGVQNGWAKISRTLGTGPWIAYGVINDGGSPGDRTGDGAFLPMVVP